MDLLPLTALILSFFVGDVKEMGPTKTQRVDAFECSIDAEQTQDDSQSTVEII